jgi:tetratricopeptide (TPR) repeat protein
VYGLGVTNNYAMVAFFPAFFVALVWVRGAAFFSLGFIGRMVGWMALGLVMYLWLPLVGSLGGGGGEGIWRHLRTEWAYQKLALTSFPPYVILLLSFTSLFPVLVAGVRWPSNTEGMSVAGDRLGNLVTRLVHGLLLVACMSVMWDPKWSARGLGFGLALLPFYYLAALAAGYFAGYFLVVGPRAERRGWDPSGGLTRSLGRLMVGVVWVGLVVMPVVEGVRNAPQVWASNGEGLRRLAEQMLRCLPAERGVYVVSEASEPLLLVAAALGRQGQEQKHVLVGARLLEAKAYHEQMGRRYGSRWPGVAGFAGLSDPLEPAVVTEWMVNLVRSNAVYYLHPGTGYFWEAVTGEGLGLVERLRVVGRDEIVVKRPGPEVLAEGAKVWGWLWGELAEAGARARTNSLEGRFVRGVYGRACNQWGVTLQRAGKWEEAGKVFGLGREVDPGGAVGEVNFDYNRQWRNGAAKGQGLGGPLPGKGLEPGRWEEWLMVQGPMDEPKWGLRLGQEYAQRGYYRRAAGEFERVVELAPETVVGRLWRENMVAMVYLNLGRVGEAEQWVVKLRELYPKEDSVLETLTQVYLVSGRLTNVLATVEDQLKLNGKNPRALLNKAAVNIQLKRYEAALEPLDVLLTLQPENTAALLDRAIAQLQSGKLEKAQRDYELLRKQFPKYFAVYYGLGEIAYRQGKRAEALEHYEAYLKHGKAGTAEYKAIEQRVQELRKK